VSPVKQALILIGVSSPGLRSLRSFTRSYQYAAPTALVELVTEPRAVARGCCHSQVKSMIPSLSLRVPYLSPASRALVS